MLPMKDMTFGEILESLMKKRKLTIRALAAQLDISPKTVQEWIGKGGRMPRNPDIIKRLAKSFDISVHYLLFGEEDEIGSLKDIFESSEIHTGLYEITIKKVNKKK
jgi:transcriptional regulator with XRE-family HTH domain